MPKNPNSDPVVLYVVEKMKWEAMKVTSPQAAGIEMEEMRFLDSLANPGHEFLIEIFSQGLGDREIFLKDCV